MKATLARYPVISGIVIGSVVLGLPHLVLADSVSVLVAALTLTFIAGIYVGFAILDGSETTFGVELVIAVGYTCLALFGVLVSRWFIVAGLVAHAAWDYLHHSRPAGLADLPGWYIPFCIVVDVALAVALALVWSA